MDLRTWFREIRVEPEDIEKRNFNNKYGQFENLVMWIRQCNARRLSIAYESHPFMFFWCFHGCILGWLVDIQGRWRTKAREWY